MKIHDLKPAEGSRKRAKRVGRGIGGKGGKTAGRGTKGQRARGTVPVGFEGGQLPLHMRVPKLRGFTNPTRVEFLAINLGTLEDRFDAGATVDAESLAAQRLIEDVNQPFKILGRGELGKALTVKAPRLSESAKQAITSAGGSFEELAPVDNTPRNRVHRRKAQGN